MKVRIKSNNPVEDFRNLEGELIAKVKETNGRKTITEYIIQFNHPFEWSYFRRSDFNILSK